MFRSILVLEAPWNPQSVKSKSVWPFVSEFAKAMDIHAYHQIFTDKESFCHWIRCYHKEKRIPMPRMLYVAAHGHEGRISGLKRLINGETIIRELKAAKNIQYVHFGSCLFGNAENLELLLKKARHITMAAGYEKSVDWLDSTIFDIMLWGRIASRDEETKGLKSHSLVKDLISEEVPGLAEKLGFQLKYRYGKKIAKVMCDSFKLEH